MKEFNLISTNQMMTLIALRLNSSLILFLILCGLYLHRPINMDITQIYTLHVNLMNERAHRDPNNSEAI